MHLTGTELLDWIALRRVSEGGVALHGLEHLDHGRKMPCYLPDVFSRLVTADERSHVLDENSTRSEITVTRCGQELSGIVTLYSIAPSMTICPHCGLSAAVPPPQHATTPESTPS